MLNKDTEEEDYFNTPHQPEAPKRPKTPEPKPDDPKYYDNEDEWEHLRPASRSWKFWGALVVIGILLGLAYAVWLRWFSPYEEGIVQYGYVEKITRRGDIFKTFEGVVIPYKAINDTIEPYPGDLVVSACNDHVAAQLLKLMLGNLPARIELERYHATIPWRGESTWIVTRVDTADVSKIYPAPDRHPLIPGSDAADAEPAR
ncbi:MAG: hypothetical protein K2I48_02045 [Muribaculaceae bacterium]|nr:hypothetical protein [Muribaculaceae bacterium]